MGQQFLIDSNVIIDYLAGKIPDDRMEFMHAVINDIPAVSVISKIEVLGFNAPDAELKLLNQFFQDVMVLDLNGEIIEQTIALKRIAKIKTPDAIIAATAIVYQLALLTHNYKDFKNIAGLTILDPH